MAVSEVFQVKGGCPGPFSRLLNTLKIPVNKLTLILRFREFSLKIHVKLAVSDRAQKGTVHIFWEGQKILRYLYLTFVLSKERWRFCKIGWPSQNIWTLTEMNWDEIQLMFFCFFLQRYFVLARTTAFTFNTIYKD